MTKITGNAEPMRGAGIPPEPQHWTPDEKDQEITRLRLALIEASVTAARIDVTIATAIGDGASPDAIAAIQLARAAVAELFQAATVEADGNP